MVVTIWGLGTSTERVALGASIIDTAVTMLKMASRRNMRRMNEPLFRKVGAGGPAAGSGVLKDIVGSGVRESRGVGVGVGGNGLRRPVLFYHQGIL